MAKMTNGMQTLRLPLMCFACTLGLSSMACGPVWDLAVWLDSRTPERFLIPDGYIGWVEVEYGVEGAPSLPVENDGYHILRILPNGRLQTSSPLEEGWGEIEYFYVDESGNRVRQLYDERGKDVMIWGASTGDREVRGKRFPPHQRFFVGSEQEYRAFAAR